MSRPLDQITGPIVLFPASDVPETYVIHDLMSDIVSQGRTPEHALSMLREALDICRTEDAKEGLGPRQPAPKEHWPPELWDEYFG